MQNLLSRMEKSFNRKEKSIEKAYFPALALTTISFMHSGILFAIHNIQAIPIPRSGRRQSQLG